MFFELVNGGEENSQRDGAVCHFEENSQGVASGCPLGFVPLASGFYADQNRSCEEGLRGGAVRRHEGRIMGWCRTICYSEAADRKRNCPTVWCSSPTSD